MAEEHTWAESITRLCEDISELRVRIPELEDLPDDISGAIADGVLHHLERGSSGRASQMNQDDRAFAIGWVAAQRSLGRPA